MNLSAGVCIYPEHTIEDYDADTVIRIVEVASAFETARLVQRIVTRQAEPLSSQHATT